MSIVKSLKCPLLTFNLKAQYYTEQLPVQDEETVKMPMPLPHINKQKKLGKFCYMKYRMPDISFKILICILFLSSVQQNFHSLVF